MSEILLTHLYDEYEILHSKLKKVADLILQYGGTVSMETDHFQPPLKKSLTQQIVSLLSDSADPLTATQIKKELKNKHPEYSTDDLLYVPQYCSKLNKAGKIKSNDETPLKYFVEFVK